LATRNIAPDLVETVMTSMEIKSLEDAGRTAMVWTEGYDGQTHHADVFRALVPAMLILAIATALLVAVL
jgi:hypothetical protein